MTWNIASYSETPGSNGAINGVNIAEGCPASDINDAIRQLMADLATALATNEFLSPTYEWVVAGGSADAITVGYTPANLALVDGMEVKFRATAPNATTTPTLELDTFPAHVITKQGGAALSPGDIPGALAECTARYNLANTRYELLNPAIGALAPIAVNDLLANVTSGTAPPVATTLAALAAAVGTGDTTKFLRGDGAFAVPAYPQSFVSSHQTVPVTGSSVSVAHGLAALPASVGAYLVCLTAEQGYSVGDCVVVNPQFNSNFGGGLFFTSTTVGLIVGPSGLYVYNKSTGGCFNITPADWALVLTART